MSYHIVRSPVTENDLARLDDRLEVIQIDSALTDAEYSLLGEWFKDQPTKTLRVYGSSDGTITDLEFLRHFPTVRSFQADALFHSLVNIDGLRHLPEDARYIGLGRTKKRLSLEPLARFTALEQLYLEGQTKDIDVVSSLRELRSVTLRSITLPDLSLLTPLTKLRALDLKLGGTRNLDLLPEFQTLDYLELWMVKGLSDLSPVAHLPHLEYLLLQALRNVEALPAMSGLVRLRRLWIETMKGLTDLSPICQAPALRQLAVVDMGHLRPEAFGPIVGHPTLESLRFGLGSKRKNDAVANLIDLPNDGDWRKPLSD
ncbi:hypothetical protein [Nocardia donostiensis]|uniref:hypothetical protein n=1 Tax=Nocardia donostiensis TaxID=1538463 RepID=UPI00111581C0|nr:hypothetical protein [Nocardia donostiensis]